MIYWSKFHFTNRILKKWECLDYMNLWIRKKRMELNWTFAMKVSLDERKNSCCCYSVYITAPLAVIRFFWSEGASEDVIHHRFVTHYGLSELPLRSGHVRMKTGKSGRSSVTQEEGLGRRHSSSMTRRFKKLRRL